MTTSEKAAIEGIVVNAETREPIRKARVALYSMGSRNRPPEVLTDAAGRFAFTGLTPGQYNLWAERHGYVRQMYGQHHPTMFGHGTPLALEPGQHLRDIVFELLPAAVITGRVLDEDREPLPGAQVQALRELPALSHDQMFPVGHAVTNDLGDYRITGLAPGSYRVSGNCQVAALTYGPTDYPNMSEADHAAVIEVAAGQEARGIEITLAPAPNFCVRGRVVDGRIDGVVLDNQQRPFPGALVMLLPEASRRSRVHLHRGSNTDQNGRFTIRGIAPGEYLLCVWEDPPHPEIIRECERAGQTCWVAPAGAQTVSLRLIPRSQSPVGQ